eukprot:TRINITY_DN425_c0_g1_i1.p1 TRINITY_DN425_c0_g1~~TRINITY_DN425_c0_g1_i1.p1  ORF type:complete len:754 (+),score=202.06 TRINITY_DN425_c0_g1_i1:34-2295(+)
MSNFEKFESMTGMRFSFINLPQSRTELSKFGVPFGGIVTPLANIPNLPLSTHAPAKCSNCDCIINPYVRVDAGSKMWICNFCQTHNRLPAHMNDIGPNNVPMPLKPENVAVEYVIGQNRNPPVYLFVIDTIMTEKDLSSLKSSLESVIDLLPPDALVGFISFSRNICLWQLTDSAIPRCVVFSGANPVDPKKLQQWLQLPSKGLSDAYIRNPFLQPVSEVEFIVSNIMDAIDSDSYPVSKPKSRPKRATGAALQTAQAFLNLVVDRIPAKILLFTAGPCTHGPGAIISLDKTDLPRTNRDIHADENVKLHKKACGFYNDMAKKLADSGHCVDIFSCSIHETGIYEMAPVVELTGGVVFSLSKDGFDSEIFSMSLMHLFSKSGGIGSVSHYSGEAEGIPIGTGVVIQCKTSNKDFKVSGALGPCCSAKVMTPDVSEIVVGEGNTSVWKMGQCSTDMSLSFFFDIVSQQQNAFAGAPYRYLQFLTTYNHPEGSVVLRVVTTAFKWSANIGPEIASGFDQETAVVLLARLAAQRMREETPRETLIHLDEQLIKFCKYFASYTKGIPESFTLPQTMTLFPQFIFHLRRSDIMQKFNQMPDQAAFLRCSLLRETVYNCIRMIQPVLLAYRLGEEPQNVILDSSSLQERQILLLDAYFHIIIHHDRIIHHWVSKEFHKDPQYKAVKDLIEMPEEDALDIMEDRFPVPKIFRTFPYDPDERYLISRLNIIDGGSNENGLFTNEVNLDAFYNTLKNVVVKG